MLRLPRDLIIYDTEYTAWKGSFERNWDAPGEHRELVEIGAVRINTNPVREMDFFDVIIRPKLNPTLSGYFTKLTDITQERVDRKGISFPEALERFRAWCGASGLYAFGHDDDVIAENCRIWNIPFPFSRTHLHDIRTLFRDHGKPIDAFTSGTSVQAFGKQPARRGHSALNDARTLVDALALLEAHAKRAGTN